VLFGGSVEGVGFVADTWEHDGSHWMRVTTANQPLGDVPYVRMAYDVVRRVPRPRPVLRRVGRTRQ